jgi:glycerol-3-phosphate acyltransferase PlsX
VRYLRQGKQGEMAGSAGRGKIRVAVDAMGGDYAPAEVVRGAVEAAKVLDVEVLLVGSRAEIEKELADLHVGSLAVRIVEATETIVEGEEPVFAVRRKPNSPIPLSVRLVKEGQADAMVSAGPTGAVMVAAYKYLGPLPGMERPVAGGPFLGLAPNTVVLDLGANVDCQPYHMVEFAVAGTVYARTILGISNPTVGLLNVGAEEGKGNSQSKEAYSLLKNSGLNFIGNVEGMDIPLGKANVIVCDGFVGNIIVKLCEGLGEALSEWLGSKLKGRLNNAEVSEVTDALHRLLSPAIALGGGPLWGVNGVVAVAHGRSMAPQILGTIRHAKIAVESGFVEQLKSELERMRQKMLKESPD